MIWGKEKNETVTICHGLKIKAQDGKYRITKESK